MLARGKMARNDEKQRHVKEINEVNCKRGPGQLGREIARRLEPIQAVAQYYQDDSKAFGDVQRVIAAALATIGG